jgi:dihydroneopterin aldolase
VGVDRILISGIRAMGVHGALPEEQLRPQPFEVSLELIIDASVAGETDKLEDTVDYAAVCEAVSRVVSSEQYRLLERLATRIADVCRADPRVEGVVVEVRKMHPPVRALLQDVGVRIER